MRRLARNATKNLSFHDKIMVNVLRRWSQPIMVVITVLVIVSFTYFGQQNYSLGSGSQVFGTLNGKDISQDAFTWATCPSTK